MYEDSRNNAPISWNTTGKTEKSKDTCYLNTGQFKHSGYIVNEGSLLLLIVLRIFPYGLQFSLRHHGTRSSLLCHGENFAAVHELRCIPLVPLCAYRNYSLCICERVSFSNLTGHRLTMNSVSNQCPGFIPGSILLSRNIRF